jgi:hypothetical protein
MCVHQTQRKYWKWLASEAPLIGGWLRRRAISSLIENGSAEATIALAKAAMRGGDEIDPLKAARYAPLDRRRDRGRDGRGCQHNQEGWASGTRLSGCAPRLKKGDRRPSGGMANKSPFSVNPFLPPSRY